jgi:hypothetical protein
MDDKPPERESIWSVAQKWLPWCLGLIFSLTIGWIAFIAWVEVTSRGHDNIAETIIAVVNKSASAVPLIVISAMFTVTGLDGTGGGILVTYRWLSNKILKPQEERIRAKAQKKVQEEAEAQGLAQGLAQGQKEGREQMQRMWEDWFCRREEAEKKEEPFDEPPPTL